MVFEQMVRSLAHRRSTLGRRRRHKLVAGFEPLEKRMALAVTMTIDPTALGLGTNYGVWVSGTANATSANFKWLDATSKTFVAPPGGVVAGNDVPLLPITVPTVITFDGADDLAGGRLTLFVGAVATPPTAPQLSGSGPAWSVTNVPDAPYLTQQTITNYGTITPYDIVEFTYSATGNSTFNLSQVDGFGLPLTLTSSALGESVGLQTGAGYTRAAVGDAFVSFMSNDPLGADFKQLIYGPNASSPFIAPPTTPGNQFFSIVNPWYWITNQDHASATPSGLLHYWDDTLTHFFQVGNTLSVNLSASDSAPRVWEGTSSLVTGVPTYTFTQKNGTGAPFTIAMPAAGFDSAQYVFGNVFTGSMDSTGDAGLVQDNIWQALNRGVGLNGVFNATNPKPAAVNIVASPTGATMDGGWNVTMTTTTPHGLVAGDIVSVTGVTAVSNAFFPNGYDGLFAVTEPLTATSFTYFIAPQGSGTPVALPASGGGTVLAVGQSTQEWNSTTSPKWYEQQPSAAFPSFTAPYNTYSKFLHYSTLGGTDARSGGTPFFINNQAYGFGEDETPNGPYTGTTVPPKFDGTIPQSSSLTVRVGPWGTSSGTSVSVLSGDFNGDGLTDIAEFMSSGQWRAALTPASGSPTTVNAGSPWSTSPTWQDFFVVNDSVTGRDVAVARASDAVVGSWWKLELSGDTWTTSFVGSWGIPDQWVDLVAGDFNGDGKEDIAGRWQENGQWWMLSDAAANATAGTYAAKNVLIGHWNPSATWQEVVAGNFTGDASGKDTIAGLEGANWWLLEWTGSSSTNTLMTNAWSAGETWVNFLVGNFSGAAGLEQQIAARSLATGAWHLLGKSGASFAPSFMAAWNPAALWLNVVAGDFSGDGTTDIAGRNDATGAWTVLAKSGSSFANADFGGAWPTSSAWANAFAGIYTEQASSPKKFGILGRSVAGDWQKAISDGTAFASSPAPGYPS